MKSFLASLTYEFSSAREPNMELRLFRLLCLAAAFLSFAVIIPVNTIQNLPWLLNVTIAVFGLVALALY